MNSLPPATPSPPSAWAAWRPYLFDLVGPFAAYFVVQAFGVGGFWALTAAGAVAAISTLANTIRKKGIDAVGLLVIIEIVASLVILVFVRDTRLMLIRPSFYTALASVYLGVSAFVGKPLSYAGSRQMAAKGGPARIAAYERAWERSAEFRQTHRGVTFAFAVCLAVDSILRVVIVYTSGLERAAWLSNVPHVSAMLLMIVCSAMAGRRFHRLVDEQM